MHWLRPIFWLDGQGLKRNMIGKIDDKEVWRRGMCTELLNGQKKLEDICVPCECSPKSDSAEKSFHNQEGRMTHSVPSHSCHCPLGS